MILSISDERYSLPEQINNILPLGKPINPSPEISPIQYYSRGFRGGLSDEARKDVKNIERAVYHEDFFAGRGR